MADLVTRLKDVMVPPSAQPIVDEARLTLEAIEVLAEKEGWTAITKLVHEGVREGDGQAVPAN